MDMHAYDFFTERDSLSLVFVISNAVPFIIRAFVLSIIACAIPVRCIGIYNFLSHFIFVSTLDAYFHLLSVA